MKGPFEDVLDKMEVKVTLIVADATMMWPLEVANKRNIPVAAYFPMSGEMFSVMHHVDLLESNNQLYADVSGLFSYFLILYFFSIISDKVFRFGSGMDGTI